MNRYPFFVYGTLLPGQPNHRIWGDNITSQKPATFIDGRLYDLGTFPMLLEGKGGPVKGMIMALEEKAYAETMTRIDALEGYNPERPEDAIYRRVARNVLSNDETLVKAWVYLGQSDFIDDADLIKSGDWLVHTAKKHTMIESWWAQFNLYGPVDDS